MGGRGRGAVPRTARHLRRRVRDDVVRGGGGVGGARPPGGGGAVAAAAGSPARRPRAPRTGRPPREAGGWVRNRVRAGVAGSVAPWSVRSAGVVTAILIGDRSGLDPDDQRRLQEAGTYHVIAISGGNIAILIAVLLAVTRAVRVPRRGAMALTLVLVAFYGYVAGLTPSVARATLAGVIYLAARLFDHRGPALHRVAGVRPRAGAGAP